MWFARAAGAIVSAVAVLIILALGYRTWRQAEFAKTLTITSPGGIVESGYVRLGGVSEWIQIRGESRSNPVLLVFAGGPGDSMIPFTSIYRPWEKYFTVVQWDQPGAG